MPSLLPDNGLPPELDFDKDRSATPKRMNLAMEYIVALIRSAFAQAPDYEAALQQLKGIGLERIDAVLAPVFTLANQQGIAIQAVFDAWVANNALNTLSTSLTSAFNTAITALANERIAPVEAAVSVLIARADQAEIDAWFHL